MTESTDINIVGVILSGLQWCLIHFRRANTGLENNILVVQLISQRKYGI